MPWQKSFDVDEAIADAMKVFWEKGYERTSISDLVEATGVPRQSLYNAVGCKRELFIKVLLKYDIEHRRAALSTLEATGEPLKAIRATFERAVSDAFEEECRGCLLINTAMDFPAQNEEVRTVVTAGLREFEAFFRQLVELGQARSEIPESMDAASVASALCALYIGVRVMGRGGFVGAKLETMPDQALALLR